MTKLSQKLRTLTLIGGRQGSGVFPGGAEKAHKKFSTYREQKRHIKLLHIKLFPVAPVTGPPGRVSGQKDLCSLGSEDST